MGGRCRPQFLAEQTAQQGDQGNADQGDTTASHELLHALRLVASHCGKKCGCGPHCAVPDQSVHSEFGGSSGISKPPPNISVFNVNSNLYTLT